MKSRESEENIHSVESEETTHNTPKEETIPCIVCGGQMVGTRSSYNGHFHGTCRNCGAKLHE